MNTLTLIATSTFGLESVVARELEQLGYQNPRVEDGKVRFEGTVRDIARCNLWLRSSDRVVIEMDCFEVTDFDELFERTKAIPWEEWIAVDAKFPVTGKSVHSQLSATPSCQKTVKKAIVERLRKTHNRHWFEETGAEYKVDIHLFKDTASITLDTSGPGLHKRGYRDLQGLAPIKETLAAGMLLLSFWKPGRPFIDPFCGTGTIPIEAAMIGLNMAPGINRSFVCEDWPQIPRGLWKDVRAEANDLRQRALSLPVIGCDIDRKVCRKAERHVRQAGVAGSVQIIHRAFEDIEIERDYGVIVTNPPYAERIGTAPEVDELYREMGRTLAHLKTWSIYVLTSNQEFEKLYGKEADRRRKLYNGRIPCTYFQYIGEKPPEEGDDVEGER
jgi:putative N6-adenine-specific DNA methylase